MSRKHQDLDDARARLVLHARSTILDDVDPADPLFASFQRLAEHAGDFLDAPAGAPARPTSDRHATTAALVVAFSSLSLMLGAATALVLAQTDLMDLVRPELARTNVASPHLKRIVPPILPLRQLPIGAPADLTIGAMVDQVIADLAAQRAAEAAAAEAAASPAGGTGTGSTSSGGSSSGSGGSSSGGAPAPAPAPSPYVDRLTFTASSGTGSISVSATVHTTGSLSVSVSCTANGSTIGLSGPGTVNGDGSYSGSFTGLAAGSYSISCTVPGQITSNTKTLNVY